MMTWSMHKIMLMWLMHMVNNTIITISCMSKPICISHMLLFGTNSSWRKIWETFTRGDWIHFRRFELSINGAHDRVPHIPLTRRVWENTRGIRASSFSGPMYLHGMWTHPSLTYFLCCFPGPKFFLPKIKKTKKKTGRLVSSAQWLKALKTCTPKPFPNQILVYIRDRNGANLVRGSRLIQTCSTSHLGNPNRTCPVIGQWTLLPSLPDSSWRVLL